MTVTTVNVIGSASLDLLIDRRIEYFTHTIKPHIITVSHIFYGLAVLFVFIDTCKDTANHLAVRVVFAYRKTLLSLNRQRCNLLFKNLAGDARQERILKEYIPGPTVAEMLRTGRTESGWLEQVHTMCRLLYPAGWNIDYYPTNFIPYNGTLYYIDYECNPYMAEWDFAHWGVQYWTLPAQQ